jgi:anti-sigma factor RsiW
MPCPDPLLVQAYADGELDAESCIGMEQHLASCPACESLRQRIGSIGATVRQQATYHRMPPSRRAAILRKLDAMAGQPRGAWGFWGGAASGAVAAALVALMVTALIPRTDSRQLASELVNAHVRSLLGNKLIDVESTDRHTVKPWFAGRVDVSPPVTDFAAQNFPLIGGRVDYLDGRRAAVVVYRHGAHVINVFSWPALGTPMPAGIESRNGYQLAGGTAHAVDSCAVSDTAPEELRALVRLITLGPPDARE